MYILHIMACNVFYFLFLLLAPEATQRQQYQYNTPIMLQPVPADLHPNLSVFRFHT